HGPTLKRERPMPEADSLAAPLSPQPRPSQVVQADELWQRMTELCPPAHRRLLELKRQGFGLAEIAKRTGLHEGSVRRIRYELARRMADAGERPNRHAAAGG